MTIGSPGSDGNWTGRVSFWNPNTGNPVGTPTATDFFLGHAGALSFSPDGSLLAGGLYSGFAYVWDVESREQVRDPISHQSHIEAIRFSPDGELLATASHDHTAQLWKASTAKAYGPPLLHDTVVRGIAFHPAGQYIATGTSYPATVQFWGVHAGVRISGRWPHDGGRALRVDFSPDGAAILVQSDDKLVLWKLPGELDSIAEMERRTWEMLGERLDADGNVESIPAGEWRRLRAELRAKTDDVSRPTR